jgi:hypothetical protein
MVLVQRSIISSRFSRSQITAFYLTQEVMEFVRNTRDNNTITGQTDWLFGLNDCVGAGNKCIIDVTNNSVSSCGTSCPVLRKTDDGLYGYGGTWGESGFVREVNIVRSIENIDEVFVETEIFWNGGTRSFLGRESIFKLN